jgi:hypothetical protein
MALFATALATWAAVDGAATARRELEGLERPYLIPAPRELVAADRTFTDKAHTKKWTDAYFLLDLSVRNHGRAPGIVRKVEAKFLLGDDLETAKEIASFFDDLISRVISDQPQTLRAEDTSDKPEIVAAVVKNDTVFGRGAIHYEDVLGRQYVREFCYSRKGSARGVPREEIVEEGGRKYNRDYRVKEPRWPMTWFAGSKTKPGDKS